MNKITEVPISLLEYLVNQATEAKEQIETLSKFNSNCTSQISELEDLADFNKRSSQENLELYKNQLEETKKLKEELENYKESFEELQYKHSNLMQNYNRLEEHIVNNATSEQDGNPPVGEDKIVQLEHYVHQLVVEKDNLKEQLAEKDKEIKKLIAKGPEYIIRYYDPGDGKLRLAIFNSPESLRMFLHSHEHYTVEELWIENSSGIIPRYFKQDISIAKLGMPLTAWLLNLEDIGNE